MDIRAELQAALQRLNFIWPQDHNSVGFELNANPKSIGRLGDLFYAETHKTTARFYGLSAKDAVDSLLRYEAITTVEEYIRTKSGHLCGMCGKVYSEPFSISMMEYGTGMLHLSSCDQCQTDAIRELIWDEDNRAEHQDDEAAQ